MTRMQFRWPTLAATNDAARSWRRATCTMVIGVTGALLAGSPAAAASPVTGLEKVVSPSPATDSQSPKSALARCPDGKKVIGGGGWVHAVGSAAAGLTLPQSAPADNGDVTTSVTSENLTLTQLEPFDDGFQVTAREIPPGADGRWRVQAYAICADSDSLAGREIVSAATPLSSQAAQQAKAVCPDGKRAIGTGARINNAGGEVALQLARSSGPCDIARAQAHEDAVPRCTVS